MKTKLTLNIDSTVLVKAKKVAKEQNRSHWELVEGYFQRQYWIISL